MVDQLALELLRGRKRIADAADRAVDAGQRLMRRDIGIDRCRRREQPAAVIRAVADDLRADARHAQRKVLPHRQQRRLFLAVAQDARLVLVQTVVFLQIARVVRPQLTQRRVEKAPPRRRACAHEHQILRTEQHGLEQALHVALPLLAHAVFVDLHRPEARQAQLECVLAALRLEFRADECRILAEPQSFLLLRRAEQPHGRAGRRRLEQVGLALPVLAADQIDRRVEDKACILVIAEIL